VIGRSITDFVYIKCAYKKGGRVITKSKVKLCNGSRNIDKEKNR